MDGYFIALVETNEEPMPLQGPFPTYDAAVDAHYKSVVEAGYEPEEGIDAHQFYLTDDAVRIARVS